MHPVSIYKATTLCQAFSQALGMQQRSSGIAGEAASSALRKIRAQLLSQNSSKDLAQDLKCRYKRNYVPFCVSHWSFNVKIIIYITIK